MLKANKRSEMVEANDNIIFVKRWGLEKKGKQLSWGFHHIIRKASMILYKDNNVTLIRNSLTH